MSETRKIVQISIAALETPDAYHVHTAAVANDGTAWIKYPGGPWQMIDPLPAATEDTEERGE